MSARVAVLMAVRDGAAMLPAALASVEAQTYRDLEVILVDDGSADGGEAVMHGARTSDDTIRLPSSPVPIRRYATRPRGLTRALNFAARRSRHDYANPCYFARLDADDTWMPDKLERQVRFMDAHQDVVLLGGCWQLPGGQIMGPVGVDDGPNRRALRHRNPFAHSTVLMRVVAFDAVGGYDESFPVAQDWALWTELAQVGRLAALPDVLATLGQGPLQVTRRRPWARRWHGVRIRWNARRL